MTDIEKAAEIYWAKHAQDSSTKDAFLAGAQYRQPEIAALKAKLEKYEAALKKIDAMRTMTQLGVTDDMTPDEAYQTGAHCAFIDAAEIAREALEGK